MMKRVTISVPAEMRKFWTAMNSPGHETRAVGGCVRDSLMGVEPKDVDFCTTAMPETVSEVAKSMGIRVEETGLQHGTVSLIVEGVAFEVTTLRVDTDCDGRHAAVQFTNDFELDASRRDFTFNAMSASSDGTLFDYFGGQQDLMDRRLRFVGCAADRVREDFLRVLRLLRFMARFDCMLEDDVVELLRETWVSDGLVNVSAERKWAELSKMFSYNTAEPAVRLLMETVGPACGLWKNDLFEEFMPKAVDESVVEAVMATMVGSAPEATCDFLKTSTAEKKTVTFFFHNLANQPSEREFARMSLNQVVDSETLMDLALLVNRRLLRWVDHDWPTCPVSGQTLLDQGMKPGPEMGHVLKRMRAEWVEQTLTAEGVT